MKQRPRRCALTGSRCFNTEPKRTAESAEERGERGEEIKFFLSAYSASLGALGGSLSVYRCVWPGTSTDFARRIFGRARRRLSSASVGDESVLISISAT